MQITSRIITNLNKNLVSNSFEPVEQVSLNKGNRLPLLSETCSTGSKLFETKFLLRLVIIREVICIFRNTTNLRNFLFLHSIPLERNLMTLVKGNRLP